MDSHWAVETNWLWHVIFSIASEKAKFGQPEVNLGIIPGYGGTQRLPRLVGKGMAKKLIYSAEMIDAQEAYRIGLGTGSRSGRRTDGSSRKVGQRPL